jgi:hypothetical protein
LAASVVIGQVESAARVSARKAEVFMRGSGVFECARILGGRVQGDNLKFTDATRVV